MQERETWNPLTYVYAIEVEEKALRTAIIKWNTRTDQAQLEAAEAVCENLEAFWLAPRGTTYTDVEIAFNNWREVKEDTLSEAMLKLDEVLQEVKDEK